MEATETFFPTLPPEIAKEMDVVELFTFEGRRYVHFMGYGYYVGSSIDGDSSHVYRFTEYVHNIISLKLFETDPENRTSGDYNEEFNGGHHTYEEDCSKERVVEIYAKGYGDKPLTQITRATAKTVPDGFYLWDWRNK